MKRTWPGSGRQEGAVALCACNRRSSELGVVALTCNHRGREAEAGGS